MPYADPEKKRAYNREWARKKYQSDVEAGRKYQRDRYHADIDAARKRGRENMKKRFEQDPEGIRKYNRECYAKTNGKEKSRAGVMKHRLKTKYGMTVEEYEALVTSQSNSCAVCKTTDKGHTNYWSVDHCHKTGKVRALLCQGCNTAIGLAKEDPNVLRGLADYLERHL